MQVVSQVDSLTVKHKSAVVKVSRKRPCAFVMPAVVAFPSAKVPSYQINNGQTESTRCDWMRTVNAFAKPAAAIPPSIWATDTMMARRPERDPMSHRHKDTAGLKAAPVIPEFEKVVSKRTRARQWHNARKNAHAVTRSDIPKERAMNKMVWLSVTVIAVSSAGLQIGRAHV